MKVTTAIKQDGFLDVQAQEEGAGEVIGGGSNDKENRPTNNGIFDIREP